MKCRKCGVFLIAGENCWSGAIKHHDYICNDCHNERQRLLAKRRVQNKPLHARAKWLRDRTGTKIYYPDLMQLMHKQEGLCAICGCQLLETRICVDHIIPRANGGQAIKENLQLLCEMCNVGKHHWTQAEYVEHCQQITQYQKMTKMAVAGKKRK